jgi:hypothetical protein
VARLAPGGVFTVSRWYQGGARDESARLVALAAATLRERGAARPRDHVILASAGLVATLLLSRDPWTAEDMQQVRGAVATYGFKLLVAPGQPDDNPVLGLILDAPDRAALDRVTLGPALDLRPPTDDRPFFFNMLRARAWFLPMPADAGGVIEGNRRATLTIGLAFFTSVALSLAAIVIPLARRARPRGRVSQRLAAGLGYFAAIGVAFMFVEIAFLQRLSLLLGHPAYSLVVVLASLIASAGLGALVSDRLPFGRARGRLVLAAVLVGLLLTASRALPVWAPAVSSLGLGARIAFAAGLMTTLGFPLGMAFPAGMRAFEGDLADELPWLWGINGVTGVIASSGAVMLALEYGITALLVIAAAAYVLAAVLSMVDEPASKASSGA